MNRKIDNLGRISLPAEMRKAIGAESGATLRIELHENKIIITKDEPTKSDRKTKAEIEEHLHNLNELIKIGLNDEKLLGTIDALNWVLDTEENPNSYLNDYDDLKENEEETEV